MPASMIVSFLFVAIGYTAAELWMIRLLQARDYRRALTVIFISSLVVLGYCAWVVWTWLRLA